MREEKKKVVAAAENHFLSGVSSSFLQHKIHYFTIVTVTEHRIHDTPFMHTYLYIYKYNPKAVSVQEICLAVSRTREEDTKFTELVKAGSIRIYAVCT